MNKRIASMLSYYKFLMKLEYKYQTYKINLVKIHEGYTSKIILDRDINASRNIYIKSYDSIMSK